MFFSFKGAIARKIKDLIKTVIRDSDKMSWRDELIAARVIDTYVKIFKEDVDI